MLTTWLRCRTEAVWAYDERLEKRHTPTPLRRGTLTHSVLEHYYRDMRDDRDGALARARDEIERSALKLDDETAVIFREVLDGYFWHWEHDDYLPLAPEVDFEVSLADDIALRGQIDLVVETETGPMLVDHKTHGRFPDTNYRLQNMQAPLYVWAARESGIPVDTFEWNYILWKGRGNLKVKVDGTLSKQGLTTMDYPKAVRQAESLSVDVPEGWLDKLASQQGDREGQFYRRVQLCYTEKQLEQWKERALAIAREMINYEPGDTKTIHEACGGPLCGYKDLVAQVLAGETKIHIDGREYKRKTDLFDYYEGRG